MGDTLGDPCAGQGSRMVIGERQHELDGEECQFVRSRQRTVRCRCGRKGACGMPEDDRDDNKGGRGGESTGDGCPQAYYVRYRWPGARPLAPARSPDGIENPSGGNFGERRNLGLTSYARRTRAERYSAQRA